MQKFLDKCIEVHGNKYDYSKVILKRAIDKIEIVCKKHGSFWQYRHNHINNKSGCPACNNENRKTRNQYSIEDIKIMCSKKFNSNYNFNNISFSENKKIILNIECYVHGKFNRRRAQLLHSDIDNTPCVKCKAARREKLKNKRVDLTPNLKEQMFLNNKYSKWYFEIIKTRKILLKERNRERRLKIAYYENHHIIPKCFGGSNLKENRVQLTYKEHYIVHWLLIYALRDNFKPPMKKALITMQFNSQLTNRKIPSWMYSKMRDVVREANSGKNNGHYGMKHTNEAKMKMSIKKKGVYIGEKNPNYGNKMSEESKQKISLVNTGKKHTKETIAKRLKTKIINGKNRLTSEQKLKSIKNRRLSIENKVTNFTDIEFIKHLAKLNLYDTSGRKNCRVCSYIRKRGWDVNETYTILAREKLLYGWDKCL